MRLRILLAACFVTLALSGCGGASAPQPLPETDRVATRVAEELAVSATLTASAGGPTDAPAGDPTPVASPTALQAPSPTTADPGDAADVPTATASTAPPPQFANIAFVPAPENRTFGGTVILPGAPPGDLVNPVFRTEMAVQVIAFFPPGANQDGVGINSVDFSIEDENGDQVYTHPETQAEYCLFGGAAPCVAWNFWANNCRWPGGVPVTGGQHKGRIQLNGAQSSEEWRFDFQVDLSGTPCAPQTGDQVPQFANIPFFNDPNSLTVGGGLQANVTRFEDGTPVLTDPPLVRAIAYLPREQNADGSAIAALDGRGLSGGNVTFTVFSPSGQVYQRTELTRPYCLFNGDSQQTCDFIWRFAEHNCRWPTGTTPFAPGTFVVEEGGHSLEITISEAGGPVETWSSSFILDLPDGSPCA